jgi:microcystin-dependent protein
MSKRLLTKADKTEEPLIEKTNKPPRSSNYGNFLANLASILLIMGVLGLMSYYAYSSYTYNGTQDIRSYQLEQHLVSNVSSLEQQILSNVSNLMAADMANMDKITLLASVLNMTVGEITFLKTINHVTGVAENIDLISDCPQIVINPQPGSIHFSLQDVILDVVTTNPMTLSITKENGTVTITNMGVLMVDGVYPNPSSGNLNLIGTGMIDVYPDPNSTHTVVVDGSAIVVSLTNLQMEDANQAIQIANIVSVNNAQQTEINNIQMVGNMIAQTLNGTTITFNETLMDLMMMILTAKSDIAALQAQLANSTTTVLPTGTMVPWAGADGGPAPTGYLLCDGTEYSMGAYPELFTVIGTMYCGMGCTMGNFKVPDMRGNVPVGKKSTGGVFNIAVGTTFGTETHTLTSMQMPIHSHGLGLSGTHAHTIFWTGTAGEGDTNPCDSPVTPLPNPIGGVECPSDTGGFSSYSWTTEAVGDHTHLIGNSGGSTAHNNVQPSLIVQYIIKT